MVLIEELDQETGEPIEVRQSLSRGSGEEGGMAGHLHGHLHPEI